MIDEKFIVYVGVDSRQRPLQIGLTALDKDARCIFLL